MMAGTSMDGIDAALVEITGSGIDARITFRGFRCCPYRAWIHERLMRVAHGEPVPAGEISELDFIVGGLFAEAAVSCVAELGAKLGEIDLIASHGQTIYHQGTRIGDRVPSTLQIGEAAVIAERTGAPVVSDFRTADVAAGGEGAPLVPYFDFVFLRDPNVSRAAQNIGGIANVTYLPAGCGLGDVIAFDTGPGNMLIDAAASRLTQGRLACDLDGEMASRGEVSQALLQRLLEYTFYTRRPPKTAGREQFGARYLEEVVSMPEAKALSAEDVIATLTALTAESIARSYRDFLPRKIDEIILSGGGAANPVLFEMIERAVGRPVRRFDEFGVPGDAKEAVAFALLGSETARGVPSNVPSATGAAHPAVLGKISLPSHWR
jgi:anhydro-N-acetylmuramic acid kinase